MKIIKTAIATVLVCGMVGLPNVQAFAQDDRHRDPQADRRHDRDDHDRREWRRYNYNHPEPGQDRYDATRYYRDYQEDRTYRARRLGRNDRIYRGSDDRYYCRRSDGTTGLIIGGITGGALGNIIAPRDSKTLGTILGAAGGAIVGKSIDRNNITCR